MRGLRPPIWRVLWAASTTRLSDFNTVLQLVMGWSNLHLHQFEKDDLRFGIPDPYFPDGTCCETDYLLNELMREAGDKLMYRYDFGGEWVHKVLLEKILPFDERIPLPLCLRGKRACPLEDIGGPRGYKDFLDILSDSAHPGHADMSAWIGEEFDPEHFDLIRTNLALEEYCQ